MASWKENSKSDSCFCLAKSLSAKSSNKNRNLFSCNTYNPTKLLKFGHLEWNEKWKNNMKLSSFDYSCLKCLFRWKNSHICICHYIRNIVLNYQICWFSYVHPQESMHISLVTSLWWITPKTMTNSETIWPDKNT